MKYWGNAMQEYVEGRKTPQRFMNTMTRQRFLDLLQEKWINDNMLTEKATVEDLLDDAACLGLPGASDAYFGYLFSGVVKKVKPAKKGPKYGSHRGSYARR